MTVQELIIELAILDPNMEVVIPGAPYNQPRLLDRVGVVILKEDETDTGVPAGEYIGLGIGADLDDDTLHEEPEEEDLEKEEVLEEMKDDPIEADSFEEFQDKLFDQIFKTCKK